MELIVTKQTVFKSEPIQSVNLPNEKKFNVSEGTRLKILENKPAKENHVQIILDKNELPERTIREWYIYMGHVAIEGKEPGNNPQDKPIDKQELKPFHIAGVSETLFTSSLIVLNGHFKWSEATKNGTRIPTDSAGYKATQIYKNIITVAKVMEEVRSLLGNKSITVISWYRDPISNRKVGGATQSRHLAGDAVDFQVEDIHPSKVYKTLDGWWGSRGGLASANTFTHIDVRGYHARWRY